MHLNKYYEAVRGQILLMDLLPSVSKARLMIERIEQQKQVTSGVIGAREITAIANRVNVVNYDGNLESSNSNTNANAFAARGPTTRLKKDNKKTKNNRFCDHCQRTGHTIDQCFKLVGYPNWYDALKDKSKGKGGAQLAAHVSNQNSEAMQDTPLEEPGSCKDLTRQFDSNLLQVLAQEMMKLIRVKQGEQ